MGSTRSTAAGAGWTAALAMAVVLGRSGSVAADVFTDPLTTATSSGNYTVVNNDPSVLNAPTSGPDGLVLSKSYGTPTNNPAVTPDVVQLLSNYTLNGNFTVTVDARLNTADPTNPVFGIGVGKPQTGAFADVFYKGLSGTVASAYNQSGGIIPEPATAPDLSILSTFRLTRAGDTLTTEVRPAGSDTFQPLNHAVHDALLTGQQDLQVELFLQDVTADPNPLQGTLSNLRITGQISGTGLTVGGEEIPEPASIAVFGLAVFSGLALRRRQRAAEGLPEGLRAL